MLKHQRCIMQVRATIDNARNVANMSN